MKLFYKGTCTIYHVITPIAITRVNHITNPNTTVKVTERSLCDLHDCEQIMDLRLLSSTSVIKERQNFKSRKITVLSLV